MRTLADLGIVETVLQSAEHSGSSVASVLEQDIIPPLLLGRDVLVEATGSDAVSAFGLPIVQQVNPSSRHAQALVLTPTRDVCLQVTQTLRAYGSRRGIDVVAVSDGVPTRTNQDALRCAQVVVGTVGVVWELVSSRHLIVSDLRYVVLDGADDMVGLGCVDEIEQILMRTPSTRQTALFSATMPPSVVRLADRYLRDAVSVTALAEAHPVYAGDSGGHDLVATIEQFQLQVKVGDKSDKLFEVLRVERPAQAVVFVRTKARCEQLYRSARDRGVNAKGLHGDMPQASRESAAVSFGAGRVPILITTDVTARALSFSTATHLINFDVPVSPDVYVHRIARVGRGHRALRAITLVEPRDVKELEAIERHIGRVLTPWHPRGSVGEADHSRAMTNATGWRPTERRPIEVSEQTRREDSHSPAAEMAEVIAQAPWNTPAPASEPDAHQITRRILPGEYVERSQQERNLAARAAFVSGYEQLTRADVDARLEFDFRNSAVDERERAILYLRYVEGRTSTEIAKRFGMTEGQVKVKLHRARHSLRAADATADAKPFVASSPRDAGVLSVPWRGSEIFPAFQFTACVQKRVVHVAVEEFRAHGASDWQIALWIGNPDPWLRATPADVLDTRPNDVARAASRVFATLA